MQALVLHCLVRRVDVTDEDATSIGGAVMGELTSVSSLSASNLDTKYYIMIWQMP
jgi:hypothetical protein